ncbi:HIRA-interacting protein 3 [Leuresthes tenuis]|uniref:HIRA-interacting protein 3 n=1 Tax=Leuresthes tenuis TaxID=355514 RepID=UPI003B5022EB
MVSEKETAGIRKFVCDQLRDEPDLSTLTLGILKKRYLARVRCESLSPEAKKLIKLVVEEELVKMQENDEDGGELEPKKAQNKRKRELENEVVKSEGEHESTAKKLRANHSSSSSESEDKEECKESSEDEEQIQSPSNDAEKKRKGNSKRQVSDDSTDDEIDESEKKGNKSNCGDSPEELVKKKENTTRGINTSGGKKTPENDKDRESDAESLSEKSDKINGSESSDSEKEEKVSVEKKNDDSDSDSSSLPSLEDEKDGRTKNVPKKKKKTVKTDESTRGQKDDDKAVVRLKRYIALCGVRRNYKKLLDGCRSIRSKVAALRKELEELGVLGKPSIEKCKKVRMKREEAQELAELDVNNIITSQGRPKRRGTTGEQEQQDPSSSTYQRTLNSGSDSDEENDTHKGRRKNSQWANLHGIISDDADSD